MAVALPKSQIIVRIVGTPVPKGSLKSFLARGSNRIVTKADNSLELGPWMSSVAEAVSRETTPQEGPVRIGLGFALPRPKSFSVGNRQRPHVVRPDLDKLVRAVLDALTGIAYRDDSQVVSINCEKRYASVQTGEPPGVTIVVTYL